jgi:hypothetical protein
VIAFYVIVENLTDRLVQVNMAFSSGLVLESSSSIRTMTNIEPSISGVIVIDVQGMERAGSHPGVPQDVEESVTERSVLEPLAVV